MAWDVTFVKKFNMFKSHPHRAIILWLLSGCFLVYIMVVVGCLTRLTHSGLSITDWNFMGSIPPISDKDWQERFGKYMQSPEFKLINYGMSMQEFKSIFWWEYIHRLIGRLIGFVFIIGFSFFLIKKKFPKGFLIKMIVLVVLGALQGLIGWWMVKSGLNKEPAVSHYRLATHLMSAFTVFAFTFWYALELIYKEQQEVSETKKLRIPLLILFVVLVIQIIYGAFTAGFVDPILKVRPGQLFNTWPKMGEDWVAEQVFMHNSLLKNILENPSGIQFIHRSLAIIVVGLVIWLWVISNKLKITKSTYKGISFLIYGVTIQFLLGVFTLIYQVPVLLGVLHQSGAFFLFAVCVFLLFQTQKRKPKQVDSPNLHTT